MQEASSPFDLILNFGDLAVAVATTLVIAAWLCWQRRPASALTLCVAVFACLMAIPVMREIAVDNHLVVQAWGSLKPWQISGHASAVAVVDGALALIVAASTTIVWRIFICMAMIIFIDSIRIGLVDARWYTSSEAISGFIIGFTGLAVFAVAYLRRPAEAARWRLPVLPAAVVLSYLLITGIAGGRILHTSDLVMPYVVPFLSSLAKLI